MKCSSCAILSVTGKNMVRVSASDGGDSSSLTSGITGESVRAKPALVDSMAIARNVAMRRRRDDGGEGKASENNCISLL